MKIKAVVLMVLLAKAGIVHAESSQDIMRKLQTHLKRGYILNEVAELSYIVKALDPNLRSITIWNRSRINAFTCRQIGEIEGRVQAFSSGVNAREMDEILRPVNSFNGEFERLVFAMRELVGELGDNYCGGPKAGDGKYALSKVEQINQVFKSIKVMARQVGGVDRYTEDLEFIRK